MAIFMFLAACGAGGESGKVSPMPSKSGPEPAPSTNTPGRDEAPIWGETDTDHLQRLGAADIGAELGGMLVSYNPPGWHDTAVHEEFHEDGVWRGIHYGRGPRVFVGRWRISDNRLCTMPESGPLRIGAEICREVWRDPRTGELLAEHVMGIGRGLLRLEVRAR